jgi:hypothetical protein
MCVALLFRGMRMNIHMAAGVLFLGAIAVEFLPQNNTLSMETLHAAALASEVYDIARSQPDSVRQGFATVVPACVADVYDPALLTKVSAELAGYFAKSVDVMAMDNGSPALALTAVRDQLKFGLEQQRVAQGQNFVDQNLRSYRRALGTQNLHFEHVSSCVFEATRKHLKPELRATLE